MVVEDDTIIAEFIARGLREAGFVVDHAADGAAGLTAAVTQSYDIAIVDVMLPKRNGLLLPAGSYRLEFPLRRGERLAQQLDPVDVGEGDIRTEVDLVLEGAAAAKPISGSALSQNPGLVSGLD